MPTHREDRPNTIHWPPIIYLAGLAGAGVLEWLWPLGAPAAGWVWRGLGGLAFVGGIGLAWAGIAHFRAVNTSFDPTARARHLATGGVYRYTRNPMYLGALIGFAGLGLALGSWWLIAMVPVAFVALTRLAIEREEAYLEGRFDDAYRTYTARVRRWL
jgi:protein-S-isoprenylcysteine O-methyltransferase Ste14